MDSPNASDVDAAPVPVKIWLSNISAATTKADLHQLLDRYGETTAVWLAVNPAGFAVVSFAEAAAAERACSELNDTEWLGTTITATVMPTRHEGGLSDDEDEDGEDVLDDVRIVLPTLPTM